MDLSLLGIKYFYASPQPVALLTEQVYIIVFVLVTKCSLVVCSQNYLLTL